MVGLAWWELVWLCEICEGEDLRLAVRFFFCDGFGVEIALAFGFAVATLLAVLAFLAAGNFPALRAALYAASPAFNFFALVFFFALTLLSMLRKPPRRKRYLWSTALEVRPLTPL